MATSLQRLASIRRQKVTLCTGSVMLASYFLCIFNPAAMQSGLALVVGLLIAGCGVFVAIVSNRLCGRRRIFAVATCIMVLTLYAMLGPNFRRSRLHGQLEKLGCKVALTTDKGDGVWFGFRGIVLPCLLQQVLGDAFFGAIDSIALHDTTVPVDAIIDLGFEAPINTLNVNSANISNHDLVRLTRAVDARQILVNGLPIDAATLHELGMGVSLSRIAIVNANVSRLDVIQFKKRHPLITVIHGSEENLATVRLP